MALHFTPAEFTRRREALLAAMQADRLDALFLFQQESMFWLTGYDTFGFCFFQCLVVRADGTMALLTRSADLRQAQQTSNLGDIRIWKDGREAESGRDLLAAVHDLGLSGKRIGVEFESYGLVAANYRKLEAAFDGLAELVDASTIVTRLRAVKSAAEIAYVRRAAALTDAADQAALDVIRAGADEGEILAAQHNAIFAGGGDYPANEFIIGSGRDALLCRYKSGRRRLDAQRSDHPRIRWRRPALPCRGRCAPSWSASRARCIAPTTPPRRTALARLRGRAEARPHGRRRLRGPCPRPRRARPCAAPAQRLRLLARRQVHAVLDGLADVLRGQ